jgi:hypothetical protein
VQYAKTPKVRCLEGTLSMVRGAMNVDTEPMALGVV